MGNLKTLLSGRPAQIALLLFLALLLRLPSLLVQPPPLPGGTPRFKVGFAVTMDDATQLQATWRWMAGKGYTANNDGLLENHDLSRPLFHYPYHFPPGAMVLLKAAARLTDSHQGAYTLAALVLTLLGVLAWGLLGFRWVGHRPWVFFPWLALLVLIYGNTFAKLADSALFFLFPVYLALLLKGLNNGCLKPRWFVLAGVVSALMSLFWYGGIYMVGAVFLMVGLALLWRAKNGEQPLGAGVKQALVPLGLFGLVAVGGWVLVQSWAKGLSGGGSYLTASNVSTGFFLFEIPLLHFYRPVKMLLGQWLGLTPSLEILAAVLLGRPAPGWLAEAGGAALFVCLLGAMAWWRSSAPRQTDGGNRPLALALLTHWVVLFFFLLAMSVRYRFGVPVSDLNLLMQSNRYMQPMQPVFALLCLSGLGGGNGGAKGRKTMMVLLMVFWAVAQVIQMVIQWRQSSTAPAVAHPAELIVMDLRQHPNRPHLIFDDNRVLYDIYGFPVATGIPPAGEIARLHTRQRLYVYVVVYDQGISSDFARRRRSAIDLAKKFHLRPMDFKAYPHPGSTVYGGWVK